jgi:uncharacterized membrane protein
MRAVRSASFGSLLVGVCLLVVLLGGACSSSTPPDSNNDGGALVCTVQAPTVCPDPAPHWADVAPIFESRCVECHNGMIGGPWPLMQYQHVADWQDLVRAHVLSCTMPPPDAGRPMTDEERTAILTWILCGFPM